MNGYYPSTNFIGALGEYPIYDYIDNTSNDISYSINNTVYNVSNILFNNLTSINQSIDGTSNTKIDSSGLQVYHKDIINPFNDGWVNVESRLETDKNDIITIKANISGIDSTISTIEGEIAALQGEVTTNTADIIANNSVTAANTAAIVANGVITTANSLAITGLLISDGNSLKKANIDAGDIGLFQTIGGAFLNIVFNQNHFKDVAILATNREFNLNDVYANLPTTKNNKITWSSPLNYNTTTDTASIDLSSITNAIQETSNNFQYYNTTIIDTIMMNNTSNYIKTLNQTTSNQFQYYITSNTDVINRNNSSNYISSLNQQTSNTFQYYITSNTDVINRNNTSNYIVSLSNTYISSNVLSAQLYARQDLFSVERQYPPKIFDTFTDQTLVTFLGQPSYRETIFLDNLNITYGGGEYIIYTSSSALNTAREGKQLFNYILNDETNSIHFTGAYNASGFFIGTSEYINDYYGDWIIIQLPIFLILTKFRFYNRPSLVTRAPSLWKCYGSLDGITFTEIVEASNSVTALISSAYASSKYEKTLNTSFNTPYKYIGFVFNKVVAAGGILNFSELQLFGKEHIELPIYISSNVLPNILSSYDKIVDRQNAISGLSSIYTTTNTTNNLYISSNNFYRGSNIYLTKSVQISESNNPNTFESSLIVGDGGKLTINGKYGTRPILQAFSKIGVGDYAETNGGLTNTSITLYEQGLIQYYGCSPTTFSHLFVGDIYAPTLSIAATTYPLPTNVIFRVGYDFSCDNTGNVLAKNISASSITLSGNITANNLTANNIPVKTPIQFTTSRQVTSGGDTYYMYDLDLRLYTKSIKLGAYNYRQFRARTWHADGDFENVGYLKQNRWELFMSDRNGLSLCCFNYYDNKYLDTLNPILCNTLFRNSFNFISYASIFSPTTVYMIIEDLL